MCISACPPLSAAALKKCGCCCSGDGIYEFALLLQYMRIHLRHRKQREGLSLDVPRTWAAAAAGGGGGGGRLLYIDGAF